MTEHPGYICPGSYSDLERDLHQRFESTLGIRGFRYLSVPSLVKRSTIERQGVVPWEWILRVGPDLGLAGSAEQGILEHFTDQEVAPGRWWASNQCFRNEGELVGWMRLLEFRKVELFSFTTEDDWEEEYTHLRDTATRFLDTLGLTYRIVDKTQDDPGYHEKKEDIEVLTQAHGWMETHSCSYFGENQSRRMGITGATHTVSNTGIATPRLLIPVLEAMGEHQFPF